MGILKTATIPFKYRFAVFSPHISFQIPQQKMSKNKEQNSLFRVFWYLCWHKHNFCIFMYVLDSNTPNHKQR